MNGELNAAAAGNVIFPMKLQEHEVSEVKSIKIEKTITVETRVVEFKDRFARLKKSLRKGSRSIL